MNDIVERLRDYARNLGGPPEDYLTWQAADEIERLQALVQALETQIKRLLDDVLKGAQNQRDEIERLREP